MVEFWAGAGSARPGMTTMIREANQETTQFAWGNFERGILIIMSSDVDAGGRVAAGESEKGEPPLYFFPEDEVTESRLRWILKSGSDAERAWALSHLLRFAQWDDIWLYVSREELREQFASIDLPDKLRQAWARMLKIEAGVPIG
jgi:hypothetical protein